MEPPPSPHAIGAVCCMCGDAGLPHELLRCKLCRVRLQHRYCSDLYPRATAYRRCNWCLREPAPAVSSKPTDKRKAVAAMTAETSTSEDEGERRQLLEAGCATTRSSRPAAEVGQPLKKQKTDERAPLPPSPGATAKGSNGNKKQKANERAELLPPSPRATAKGNNGNKKHKANEKAELPPSPGATAKGNNGNKKHKANERAELPPSPGAAKGNNGITKHKSDERAAQPPSPGATAKGKTGNSKQKSDVTAAQPTSPGATAKGNNGNVKQKADETAAQPTSPGATKGSYGNKKPMQAGKLTRPGRVKVRRYKLLTEVISC